MYINKRDRKNAIKKVTIQFGTLLGLEKDEEAEIVMREPTQMEVCQWREAQTEGETKLLEKFRELLNDLIISHNLMEDEKDKMAVSDVIDLIYEKMELVAKVLSDWTQAVFPTPQNRKERK